VACCSLEYVDENAESLVACNDAGLLRVEDCDGHAEEHGIRVGDTVLVPSVVNVARGDMLLRRHRERERVLATIPFGEQAHAFFDGPRHSVIEEVNDRTGVVRRFVRSVARGRHMEAKIRLVSVEADATWAPIAQRLPEGAELHVSDGVVVRRGDLLATVGVLHAQRPPFGVQRFNDERLRAMLSSRSVPASQRARIAITPGRATFKNVPRASLGVVLEGAMTVYHLPRASSEWLAFEGKWIYPGDVLTEGFVDHRVLGQIIGRDALIAHLVGEMRHEFALHGVAIPGQMIELMARQIADDLRS
jgi:hypothetical protein